MSGFNFFALASRMKYIYRWGLMRNTDRESLSRHSLEVAMTAHALGVINNEIFGGNIDAQRLAVLGMYHDMSEIITGDMPTPIKYMNKDISAAYKSIEKSAKLSLEEKLPKELKPIYHDILFDDKYEKFIKAADKISAYIKCTEEENAGNRDFVKAKTAAKSAIEKLGLPEADYFMENFIPAFELTLDEI